MGPQQGRPLACLTLAASWLRSPCCGSPELWCLICRGLSQSQAGEMSGEGAARASGGRGMWWGCLATCRPWGLSPVFPPRLVHTCDSRSSGRPTIPVGASPLTWGLARRTPGAWGVVRQHAPLPEDRLLPFCGLSVPPADSRFSGTLNLPGGGLVDAESQCVRGPRAPLSAQQLKCGH